jgi:hypothetical protein
MHQLYIKYALMKLSYTRYADQYLLFMLGLSIVDVFKFAPLNGVYGSCARFVPDMVVLWKLFML